MDGMTAVAPKSKAELAQAMGDKAWRMGSLYSIVDESGAKVRYHRRKVQQEFAAGRHGLDVVLKSRQHGLSTETDLDILDDCLTTPNLSCGIIAHTKIDAQTLFATKIRGPYEDLHPYVRDYFPTTKCDSGTLRLENGSEIRVAVSFRSATTHRLHISEHGEICAKYPLRAEEIQTGTLPSIHPQLGGRVVIEGTAHGAAGNFYDLCVQARADTAAAEAQGVPLSPLQYKFHFFPWFRDPKNATNPIGVTISDELLRYFERLADEQHIVLSAEQRAWYGLKRDGAGGLKEHIKREHPATFEEAFESSVEGAVYAHEMDRAQQEGRIGFYPAVESQPVYTAWDLGYGDATVVVFVQFIRNEVRFVDFYEQAGRGAPYHAAQIQGKRYNYGEHYMPHDVMNHEKGTGIVLKDTYQSLFGPNQRILAVPRPKLKADAHAVVRDVFSQFHFNARTCQRLIQGLSFYRYEWDEERCRYSKDPVHDWASHIADAVQTLACQYRGGTIGGQRIGFPTAVPAYADAEPSDDYPRISLKGLGL